MTSNPSRKSRMPFWNYLAIPVIIIFLILIIPFIPIIIVVYVVRRRMLFSKVRREWFPQGKFILIVTSDSPVWSDYFQKNVIERFGNRAFIVNYSKKKLWNKSDLTTKVLPFAVGTSDYAPSMIVFHPWNKPVVFRFYRAFKDHKHGKPQKVEKILAEAAQLIAEAEKAQTIQ